MKELLSVLVKSQAQATTVHTGHNLACHPCGSMSHCFKNYDTADPAVHEVVSVKGNVEQLDQWVVATGQQEQRQHVHDRQYTCAVSDLGSNITAAPMDAHDAKGDVHCQVA